MALHGRFGDDQPLGDLAVRESARHECEHLALAWRESLEHGCRRFERIGAGGEVLDQPARDRGREQGVAAVDDADRLQKLLARGVFEEESGGAGTQGAEDVLVEVEGREHEHARRRLVSCAREPRGALDAVHLGHGDVHEDHVRPQLACPLDRLGAVARLADDLKVVLRLQEEPEAGPDELLVIDQQQPDAHLSPPIGSRAATRKPPPTRRPVSSCPPRRATRSRMPMMPCPAVASLSSIRLAPSSTTSTSRSESLNARVTVTRVGCVCLSTFVSASCTMRKTESSTPPASGSRSPVTSSCTGSPAARKSATSSSRFASDGCGRSSALSSGLRSSARIRRSSARLCSPLVSTRASVSCAVSGELRRTSRAPRTPTSITLTEWATMSCNSREIDARSSCTAIRASCSRSRSSRRARASSSRV